MLGICFPYTHTSDFMGYSKYAKMSTFRMIIFSVKRGHMYPPANLGWSSQMGSKFLFDELLIKINYISNLSSVAIFSFNQYSLKIPFLFCIKKFTELISNKLLKAMSLFIIGCNIF